MLMADARVIKLLLGNVKEKLVKKKEIFNLERSSDFVKLTN